MNTLATLATLVTLTHTDGRTLEAALVKLGAAHIIVRIGEADARFSRKNGLRINGNHVRGVGYSDWLIGAPALQALTGEPPAATLQGVVEEQPVTVAAGEKLPGRKVPKPAAATLPAATAETPYGVRALSAGRTLHQTHFADDATADVAATGELTYEQYLEACDACPIAAPAAAAPAKKERKPRAKKGPALGVPAIGEEPDLTVDPGHPATPEQEAEAMADNFTAPAEGEFPAQLPEMEEAPPVATVAPSAASEEPTAPAHRNAIVPPAFDSLDAMLTSPRATTALGMIEEVQVMLLHSPITAHNAGMLGLVEGALRLMRVAPAPKPTRAAKPVSDAPKTFRGDTTAKPGVLTDLQQKLMRTVGNGLAKARREADDTTPVTAADALATNSPWFARLAKDKHQQGAQFAADHANEKLKGAPSEPPPAKGSKGAKKKAPAAPAAKPSKTKKASIAAGSRVDIKESVREEYADVVGESQMTGLEVLSITGKNARCKTNAGVVLPKVALVDLAIAA